MNYLKHSIEDSLKSNTQDHTKRSIDSNETTTEQIEVTVVFGMPARDCAYHGICSIKKRTAFDSTKAKCLGVANIIPVKDLHLLYQFYKEFMSPLTMEKHFGSSYFIVLEDYQIPEFVGEAIGQCANVIRQGIYPILDKGEYYEVIF